MAWFFASGHAVDLILVVIVVEFAVLSLRRGRPGGATGLDRALALLPGACLLLALRCALTGAPWFWIAAPLALSFPIHLADVIRRRL